MQCKFCQFDIPAADIELSQRLAKCRSCNQVFVIDLPAALVDLPPDSGGETELPARPEKVQVVDENGQGYMQWRWFHWMAFGLLFFCIAWDSFLVFWYANALFWGGGIGGVNLIAVIFPIVHVAVGVGLTYYTLCLFFNRTQVIYDGNFVSKRSGPIPTFRNRSYAREEIKRLESDFKTQTNKGSTHFTYHLYVVGTDNVRKPLLSNETDMALVRYVQRQLELWLQLPAGKCPNG